MKLYFVQRSVLGISLAANWLGLCCTVNQILFQYSWCVLVVHKLTTSVTNTLLVWISLDFTPPPPTHLEALTIIYQSFLFYCWQRALFAMRAPFVLFHLSSADPGKCCFYPCYHFLPGQGISSTIRYIRDIHNSLLTSANREQRTLHLQNVNNTVVS